MNRPHIEIGPLPVNIGAAYPGSLNLLAQVRLADPPSGVLYSSGTVPPTDSLDWFLAEPSSYFRFCGGAATWARTVADVTVGSSTRAAYAILGNYI